VREERVNFHLLHDEDLVRLKQQMYCPVDEEPVDKEHIVKGFEIEKGKYVLIGKDDLGALEPESGREIEVLEFVPENGIDPVFYDRTYYLGPDGFIDKYSVLKSALTHLGKTGICKWVMRRKSYLGALKTCGNVMCLSIIRFDEDVVKREEIRIGGAVFNEKELTTAKYLIEALAGEFNPEDYENAFHANLLELIARKARGEKVSLPKAQPSVPTPSDKLLEMLEASLEKAGSRRK
jgi:DNA end-binding protein Ku